MFDRLFALLPGRSWTACLWALACAGLLAGADFRIRAIAAEADGLRLLLLPREAGDEAARQRLAASLAEAPEIRRAKWLAPQELAQATAAEISGAKLTELFSSESAWLPWVMEVDFGSAAANRRAVEARVAALRQSSDWRLALWDDAALADAAARIETTRLLAGAALAAALLLGALALAGGAPRAGGPAAEALRNALLFAALGGGLLAAAWGRNLADERTAALFAAAGFALAALAGPMLKGRALAQTAIPPQE